MNFIEQLLGLSPDGNSGWTEATYLALVLMFTVALVVFLRGSRELRRRRK